MASDAEGEEESYHRTDHSQGKQRGDPNISEQSERTEHGKSERSVRGIRVRSERVTTKEQSTSEEEVDTQHFHFFRHTLKRNSKILKEQISEENELSHRCISKKIKLNKESQFKSPGNRKQFTSNENLIHNLEEALRAVKTEKYDRAKSVIREPLADSKKQNKLVHVVDRLIAGWDAANEYGSDIVASDFEDEKRIRHAEQHALSKRMYSMETKTVSRGMQPGFSGGSSVSGTRNCACNNGQPFLGNGNLPQLCQPGNG